MKFYVGLAISVFLLAGTASAQHANFGVKGGLNYYKINNDNNVTYDARTGYHVGMLLHIHLSESFAIQPELLYSAQGARFNSGNGKVNLNLGYVNLPLMFQYMFENGFRIEAGPQLGILTKATSESNGNNEDIIENLKKLELGIGAGVSYINPPTGWGIYTRYNHGLSNINEDAPFNSYNRGVQLGVLYLFQHR